MSLELPLLKEPEGLLLLVFLASYGRLSCVCLTVGASLLPKMLGSQLVAPTSRKICVRQAPGDLLLVTPSYT